MFASSVLPPTTHQLSTANSILENQLLEAKNGILHSDAPFIPSVTFCHFGSRTFSSHASTLTRAPVASTRRICIFCPTPCSLKTPGMPFVSRDVAYRTICWLLASVVWPSLSASRGKCTTFNLSDWKTESDIAAVKLGFILFVTSFHPIRSNSEVGPSIIMACATYVLVFPPCCVAHPAARQIAATTESRQEEGAIFICFPD